jgi:hypothetical protein
MNRVHRNLGSFGVLLTLTACGGLLDNSTRLGGFLVMPTSATVAPHGTVQVNVQVIDTSAVSYIFTVVGGSSSGTIVPDSLDPSKAVYTAPSTPGDYVVHAGYVDPTNHSFIKPIVIFVR